MTKKNLKTLAKKERHFFSKGFFKNFKIRTKLLFGFSTIVLIALILNASGLIFVKQTGDVWEKLNIETAPEVDLLGRIESSALNMLTSVHEAVLISRLTVDDGPSDPVEGSLLEEELEQVETAKEKLNKQMEEYESILSDTSSDESVFFHQKINQNVQNLIKLSDEFIALNSVMADARKMIMAKEQIEEAEGDFLETITLALDNQYEEFEAESLTTSRTILRARITIITFSILTILFSVALAILFSRLIASPIISLRDLALKVSQGDLGQKISIKSKDEIGDLATSFNLMTTKLKAFYTDLEKKVKEKTNQLRSEKMSTETERAKLATFLASIGEGIIAVDMDGRIITVNKTAEKMFGKPFRAVAGQIYMEHYHFEDEEGNVLLPDTPPFVDVFTKQTSSYAVTYFTKKDGDRLPLATTVSPILVGGKLIGIIGTFRDISKEKEVEEAKNDFISLASHQLRTPLTSIKWMLQAAEMMKDMEAWKEEYLGDAILSMERMIGLVHDLLNVSQLEEGSIAVKPVKTDVGVLIDKLIKTEARVIAKTKKQKIQFKKPVQKITLSVDRQLLRQVVSNLISNALRYSEPGKKVTVSVKKSTKGVDIAVKDEGIGMTPAQLERIFEARGEELPEGVTAKVEKNRIELEGIDKEILGRFAAVVREQRGPEPYKGKGIKYVEEHIRRKVGKAGVG